MASEKRLKALEEKAAAAQKKLDEIKAQRRALENAVRAREKAEERKKETRRKILIGAAILAKVERQEWPRERLLSLLNGSLTRDDDRALFGLPPIEPDGGSESTQGSSQNSENKAR